MNVLGQINVNIYRFQSGLKWLVPLSAQNLFQFFTTTFFFETFPLESALKCKIGEAGKVLEHNLIKVKTYIETTDLLDVV